jgi:hypothetical protein
MNLLFNVFRNDMVVSANHTVKQTVCFKQAMGEDTKRSLMWKSRKGQWGMGWWRVGLEVGNGW